MRSTPGPLHPLLGAAFDALDRAEVRWCLLRGESNLAEPPGDLDLLVARADLAAAAEALEQAGFVRLSGWGAGSHRAFLGYHRPSHRWIELDLQWELEYGRQATFLVNWALPALRTPAATACLSRRRRCGDVWLPHPDDAFWTLLLHCIIDKGAVPPRHAARLVELAGDASTDGLLATVVTAACPAGWDAPRILDCARRAAWSELIEVGAALPERATAAHPLATRSRAFQRGVGRLAVNAVRRPRWRGVTVALLGPDGAGKSTLAKNISASFFLPSRVVYMGLWQGDNDDDLPLWRAGLAAVNRPAKAWRRYLISAYHRARGRLVIFDRHIYDAFLPPAPPFVGPKRLFFSFLGRCCPPPDLVLVLDVPSGVLLQRRPEENDVEAKRRHYLALGQRLSRAHILPADRPPEELCADAVGRIWDAYRTRRGRKPSRFSPRGGQQPMGL